MKKIMNRLLAGVLSLAAVFTTLPVSQVQATEKQYWTESAERVGMIEKVMNDGSIGSTFNEGMMKVDGETAYCVDINTNFQNVYKTRADASTRMSADQIAQKRTDLLWLVCRKARQHKLLVSNREVQIDRQQPNNRAESHGTQGIFPYPACVNKALKVDIRFFRQEGFSLNEETWVRDIKEKREVYGISQQKLALAAGITRPYLSDIETGKAHPSEALQEAISEALERFNPDNPLEMLFDYVRIRFPTTDVKHIVEDVLRLKLPYFIHEDYGFYSYTEHYYLGDIFVLVSPELEKGVLLELKGRGCRQFESYLLAQERSWYEFFMDVLMEDGVMKRLDLAINDKTGILNIPHLTEKCRNEECISVFRSFKSYRSGELVRREEKECMGNTLYIGSLQSEVYFCIYEKDYEQYKKHDIPIEDAEVKNRFEIRLKNERAFYAIRDLLEHDNPERTAFQIINRYVRFVDRDDTKPRSDWRISEEWAWFIGEHRGSLKLTTKPEPYSFERTLHWLSHQVAPTLKLALRLDKMNHTQIVHDIITHAKLTEKHEKILKQQAAAAKEVVL